MKTLQLITLFLIFTSCAVKKKLDYKDIIVTVKAEDIRKGEKIDYGRVRFFNLNLTINNNSNQDITILKPSTEYGYQMDFFNVSYQCNDLVSIEGAPKTSILKKSEKDLITIKRKSKVEFKLKGKLYDVICTPYITQVKVTYDTTEELPERLINKIGNDQNKLIEKLTPLKIESKEITIKY